MSKEEVFPNAPPPTTFPNDLKEILVNLLMLIFLLRTSIYQTYHLKFRKKISSNLLFWGDFNFK